MLLSNGHAEKMSSEINKFLAQRDLETNKKAGNPMRAISRGHQTANNLIEVG